MLELVVGLDRCGCIDTYTSELATQVYIMFQAEAPAS